MKKGAKITLITTGVLALSGALYFLYRKFDKISESLKSGKKNNTDNTQNNIIAPHYTGVVRNDNFPLKKGSYGHKVENLQKFINFSSKLVPHLNVKQIKEDGYFGKNTEKALDDLNLPTTISASLYNEYIDRYNRLKRNASGTPRHKPMLAHTDKKRKAQENGRMLVNPAGKPIQIHKTPEKQRMQYLNGIVNKLQDELITTTNFKDQKLFNTLLHLPEKDFIAVTRMYNNRNINNGGIRTLASEIRGSSGIKDEEELLARFDYYFDEYNLH